jgi:carbon storage regulator
MLVLTRRKNESIVITINGEIAVVRVLEVSRDRVRLGITAPRTVAVHRDEILRRLAWEAEHNPPAVELAQQP